MSPSMAMAMSPTMYTPTSDVMERHEYGITKNHRKLSSTGGGRAWSEDEEIYLLQTRLQKMPYKHIAAHLKKTELACRLHYHQLSHGSNRRKRTTSMSSGSSSTSHSPLMHASIPSPIRETPSRSISPPGPHAGYPTAVQLPSIMNAAVVDCQNFPRLPAILPKPANMGLAALSGARYSALQDHAAPVAQHSGPLLPLASYPLASYSAARSTPPPPPPPPSSMGSLRLEGSGSQFVIDMGRLHAAYNLHRNSFWSAIAAEYGNGVHPSTLEQAWRTGSYVESAATNAGEHATSTHMTPPVGSPEAHELYGSKQDRTRISAILGIDANPRSPKERELVKRLEQKRVPVGVGA